MGVILVDLEKEDKKLFANWWNWRPIVELIKSFELLDEEMLDRMSYNGCGGALSAEQAHVVGKKLKEEILPKIRPEERVLLDLNKTAEPDDGTMHYDDQFKNYSATRDFIEQFADFCLASQGFNVY